MTIRLFNGPIRATFVLCVLLFGSTSAFADAPQRSSDVVRDWNTAALNAVRTARATDAQAARLYAMVNVAMYDAVNGVVAQRERFKERDHALVPATLAPRQADLRVAAAVAAHDVLTAVYPDQKPQFDAILATIGAGGSASAGQTWGARVAEGVLAARASDGSSPDETRAAGTGPGQFRASWSGAQFRNLVPFAIADANVYVSVGPPSLSSLDYAAALAEVQLLGNAAIADADKLATFQFWSLAAGTNQPAGAWLQVALAVTGGHSTSIADSTRLFALLAMAMADTVAPTVMTKFVYNAWRPATAIREADTDGNPLTTADPSWAPRGGGIGANPEHWSGHSVFSAAAATVLAGFFCSDGISFSLATDSAPQGRPRTYPGFAAAADEAGESRIFGGVHFQFSNQAGLAAGRAIGAEVLAHKLLLKHGMTHFGQCPL